MLLAGREADTLELSQHPTLTATYPRLVCCCTPSMRLQVTFFSNLRGLNVTQPVYNGFTLYDRQAELIVFQAPCTDCTYKLGEILFYLYFTEAPDRESQCSAVSR